MPSETSDDGLPRAGPPVPADPAHLRHLRHRIALLLVTFSVVILPNLYTFAADLLQGL